MSIDENSANHPRIMRLCVFMCCWWQGFLEGRLCLPLSLYPNDAKSQPFLFFILCNKKKSVLSHCHVIANYSNFDIYLNLLRLWLLKKKLSQSSLMYVKIRAWLSLKMYIKIIMIMQWRDCIIRKFNFRVQIFFVLCNYQLNLTIFCGGFFLKSTFWFARQKVIKNLYMKRLFSSR